MVWTFTKGSFNNQQLRGQKGLFNLAQACIVDGDFWVPNEIDS